MIVSTLMIGVGGAFVAKRFAIPRTAGFEIAGKNEEAEKLAQQQVVSTEEKRGERNTGIAFLIFVALTAILAIPPWAALRNQVTGRTGAHFTIGRQVCGRSQ